MAIRRVCDLGDGAHQQVGEDRAEEGDDVADSHEKPVGSVNVSGSLPT
jgi:hypothetical protein